MWNLLSAGFYRLLRHQAFRLSVISTAGCGLYMIAATYLMNRPAGVGRYCPLTWVLFEFFIPVSFMTALLCPLLIGGEHGNGFLRGKLIMGYDRGKVYLANTAVCMAAGLLLSGLYIVISCTLGAAVLQPPALPVPTVLYYTAAELLAVTALCAVYACLSMLLPKRTLALSACIVLTAGMLFLTVRCMLALREEEWMYLEKPIVGTYETEWTAIRNPSYVTGERRRRYILLCDMLPLGQYMQISDYDFSMFGHLPRMMLFSLGETVGSIAAGMMVFKRQDVK